MHPNFQNASLISGCPLIREAYIRCINSYIFENIAILRILTKDEHIKRDLNSLDAIITIIKTCKNHKLCEQVRELNIDGK